MIWKTLQTLFIVPPHGFKNNLTRHNKKIMPIFNNGCIIYSWPNGLRVGLERLRVRVSDPVGIVGGGSECPVLSPPSIP